MKFRGVTSAVYLGAILVLTAFGALAEHNEKENRVRARGQLGPRAAEAIAAHIQLDPGAATIARMRGATLRFRHGGSGAFVSPRGLVVTSHKVASRCLRAPQFSNIQRAAKPRPHPNENFFRADTAREEVRCPDVVIEQSEWLADVSLEVRQLQTKHAGTRGENSVGEAIRKIQVRCEQNSKALCWVEADAANQRFDLFRTRVYRDVRLVFLPEAGMVTFGGQEAQFRFPKYSFDVAFLRVYEAGKPLMTPTFLPFTRQDTALAVPSVLLGYATLDERSVSESQKEFLKEIVYPFLRTSLRQQVQVLRTHTHSEKAPSPDLMRELAALAYWRKAVDAAREGLFRDPVGTAHKPDSHDSQAAQTVLSHNDTPDVDPAYDFGELYRQHAVIVRRFGPTWSALAMRAREWVRLEDAQMRIRSGGGAQPTDRDRVRRAKQTLTQPLAVDLGIETKKLAWGLRMLRAQLGADHVVMRRILDGRSPEDCAAYLIENTNINDGETLRRWLASPQRSAPALSDPLVRALRLLEDLAQNLKRRYAQERAQRLRGPQLAANQRLDEETLSVSNPLPQWSTGVFKGLRNDARLTPWRSQLGGVYLRHRRAENQSPYHLSQAWEAAMPRLNFTMPYNLLSTHDADLAESGAPLVDGRGNILAVMIDVNEAQIGNRFIHHGEPGRIISLHASAIVHILREVYETKALLREISVN